MKPRAGFLKGETKLGLPWRLSGKESACNAEDVGLIPGQGAKIPHASMPKNQNTK